MVAVPYIYNVAASDPDGTSPLVYSLTIQPTGMTINSETGLIEWIPNEIHNNKTHHVEVKVIDSNDLTMSATQAFDITVKPAPPKKADLIVTDAYDYKTKKRLSVTGTIKLVQTSDDKYQEITGGDYISFNFSDITLPVNAKLASVIVCVEHYEEGAILPGKLHWTVGTGWPDNPEIWIAVNALTRNGKQNESVDSFDVTSFVETPERLRTLQLQIQNNDSGSQKKSMIDHVYLIVEWDWSTPVQDSTESDNSGLVQYGNAP